MTTPTNTIKDVFMELLHRDSPGEEFVCDSDLIYELVDEFSELELEESREDSRWYSSVTEVRSIKDINGVVRYFRYPNHFCHGDGSIHDMGLSYPSGDDIVELFPVEVKAFKYVTKAEM